MGDRVAPENPALHGQAFPHTFKSGAFVIVEVTS